MLWLMFVVIFVYLYINVLSKYEVKWSTLFKPGFVPNNDEFGVYCYCGKQGRGKTYSVVEYLLLVRDKIFRLRKNGADSNCKEYVKRKKKIYANVESIKGVEYTYIKNFKELLAIEDYDCIIVFDEIFSAMTKNTKMNEEIMEFLSQMRKRRNIFITTAQEWSEIHITFRRYCRYQIECNMKSYWKFGLLFKKFYDAELLKWDNEYMDWVAPLHKMTISKCLKSVALSYDTYERIRANVK